ncbi:MAG: hypothetical protein EA421_04990 [Gemmatimonadales bacterium]|nr:MAG: hypothetical protein EA421_04990 [Gemmatimonadales bacterium]
MTLVRLAAAAHAWPLTLAVKLALAPGGGEGAAPGSVGPSLPPQAEAKSRPKTGAIQRAERMG